MTTTKVVIEEALRKNVNCRCHQIYNNDDNEDRDDNTNDDGNNNRTTTVKTIYRFKNNIIVNSCETYFQLFIRYRI